jgi:hypothetical protein
MLESAQDAEHTLESRLGVFLLKDPTVIERLPAGQGSLLDRLVEANSLEPLLHYHLEAQNAQSEVSSQRASAWKMSRLCATARAMSYRTALDEIVDLCTTSDISVRLLRGTQVAFYLCEEPELRPINHLEIQVPPHLAAETYELLKSRRFQELDDLSGLEARGEHHMPPLERDGVTVSVFRRSCAALPEYRDDPFPMHQFPPENNPEVLKGEPLLSLLILEVFEQSFCRALTNLLDIHRVVNGLKIDWDVVLEIVSRLGVERQFYCILSLVVELFNSPVDADFLARLEASERITPEFQPHAQALVRTLVLQFPVPFDKVQEARSYFGEPEVAAVSNNARETQVLPQLTRRSRR